MSKLNWLLLVLPPKNETMVEIKLLFLSSTEKPDAKAEAGNASKAINNVMQMTLLSMDMGNPSHFH
jgi:hypothetical protein